MKAKKLPSGSWRVLVFDHDEILRNPDGTPQTYENGRIKKKKFYKSFTSSDPSPKGKREAEKMAAEWASNKELMQRTEKLTVYEAVKKYIDMKSDVLSTNTKRGYKTHLNNHYRTIECIQLDKLKQTDLQMWANDLAGTLSPKTIRNAYGLLTATLSFFNPGITYRVTLPQQIKPELYTPSDDDMEVLLSHIRYTELEKAVLLAAFGGLRRGEICALTDKDIIGNVVRINKSAARDNETGKIIIKQPKTKSSYRFVELPEFVADIVRPDQPGPIVRMYIEDVSKRFCNAVRECGLPHFRFHDCRSFTATTMHNLNIPNQYIQARHGWQSDRVMKERYQRTMEPVNQYFTDLTNEHFKNTFSHIYTT